MGVRQSTPGEGGKKARTHFSYVGTDAKRPWFAYVAGPCMWYECHTVGKSQPCLLEATDGELECPRCHEIKPTESIGYQPLYRAADSKPVVVIVHEYSREIVDALPFHRRVLVKREPGVGEGVSVTVTLDATPKFITTLAEKSRPQQPIESLLRMWRYPQLIVWHNETEGTTFPVCHTPPQKKARQPKEAPAAPAPEVPAGNMGETAMEALEKIRLKNEAFASWAKNGGKNE